MDPSELKTREDYAQTQARIQELTQENQFSSPEFAKANKRLAEIQPILDLYDERKSLIDDLALLEDPEMAAMAAAEKPALQEKLAEVTEKLRVALVPKDPNDSKDVIVEIRAGAGGDESSLFAGELFRTYARYAETSHWKMEIDSESPSDVGGFKEVTFEIHGTNIYGQMKYESGVHRVQRVPATESQGRVHTSTVTVAVLPEAEEHDLEINENDLRIDVYRSGGNGGQSVNTTDSAVRITHIPTGTVVAIQDEKSQLKNKQKAMSVLRSRLLAQKLESEMAASREARLAQIGTGDRSEKIRTYNFPQDRITDHRIGRTQHGLPQYMAGDIGPMIAALQQADMEQKLTEAGV